MKYCTECQTLEPRTETISAKDAKLLHLPYDAEMCSECGECDCFETVPEHDDNDKER